MKIAVAVSHFLAPSNPDELLPEDPHPGAADFMNELMNREHEVIIHDERCNDIASCNLLKKWLFRHGIPFTDIWVLNGKPKADVFLDVRVPGFDLHFPEILELLK